MDKIHLVVIEKKLLNQGPSFHVIPCANKEKAWEIVDEVVSIEREELLETIIDYPTDLEEEKGIDGENKYYHTEMYLIDNKTFDMEFVYLDVYVEVKKYCSIINIKIQLTFNKDNNLVIPFIILIFVLSEMNDR